MTDDGLHRQLSQHLLVQLVPAVERDLPYTSDSRAARSLPATVAGVRSRSGGNSPPQSTSRSIRAFPSATQRLTVAAPWEKPSAVTRGAARAIGPSTSACSASR